MEKRVKSIRTADTGQPALGLLFFRGRCDYEKLRFYFIADGSMNIIHLTFSFKAHREAVARLSDFSPHCGTVKDKYCTEHLCHMFHQYITGQLQHFPYSVHSPFYQEATEFQKSVWKRVSRIRYGRTKTYGELANAVGGAKLARAVGMACNQNPLALLIPCHRVVEKKGLGGYSGGVEIKKRLLAIEGVEVVEEKQPKRRVYEPRKRREKTLS